jgi:predicted metallo-beta-lactamase superfamily hydrolase
MEIIPLAFDSMGARGMSFFVKTQAARILVDPGVNLAPKRHKLPPHPLEEDAKKEMWKRIEFRSLESDIVILSHYHYDHLNPDGYSVFYGKDVFLKHPEENLNYNQMRRASLLLEDIKGRAKQVRYADGEMFSLGDLIVEFSRAVPHGIDTRRGSVVELYLEDPSCKYLYTSDIEGANLDVQMRFIVETNPDILLIDGPAITFPNSRTHRIDQILKNTDTKTIVVDHHIMRETNWRDYVKGSIELARSKGTRLISAAEFGGDKENLLEARRRELFKNFPCSVSHE